MNSQTKEATICAGLKNPPKFLMIREVSQIKAHSATNIKINLFQTTFEDFRPKKAIIAPPTIFTGSSNAAIKIANAIMIYPQRNTKGKIVRYLSKVECYFSDERYSVKIRLIASWRVGRSACDRLKLSSKSRISGCSRNMTGSP